jgi:tripartite-type tricarboxylate transporter receptor subunit TctC
MKRLIVAMALVVFASVAQAQMPAWPSRQITLIVPFPPGGSTDVVARIMAERMRPLLGQPVIIENVGGAGGSIGIGRVARAAPDGYIRVGRSGAPRSGEPGAHDHGAGGMDSGFACCARAPE